MRDSVEVASVRGKSRSKRGRRYLERDMPTTTRETKNHADGEENAPYENLETHVKI